MLRRIVAIVGVVALGVGQAALGAWSEQIAALFPEVAALRLPVLALTIAFCAGGQVALVLWVTVGRRARGAIVAVLVTMAASLVVVLALTQARDATPPAVALGAVAGIIVCLALSVAIATRREVAQDTSPAARAGSA